MSVRKRVAIGVGTALALVAGFGVTRIASDGAEEAASAEHPHADVVLLIDEGVAFLKQTTISYPAWLKKQYAPGVRETTAWYKAFAKFDAAKVALTPPPPTTTEPPPPTTEPPPPTTTEPPPPPDTQAPSVPSGQQLVDITETSARMVWNASTDNVGVTNYNVFLDGSRVAQPVGLEWTYSGLSCGTTYQVGLTAQDAAGNVSDVAYAQGPLTTTACAPPPPPTTTAPPPTTTAPPPPPPPPPPPTASLFLAPGGNDSGSCTEAAPCRTFARAYEIAVSGATVSVGAGTYPIQRFGGGWESGQPAGTKTIAFVGAPGNIVRGINVGSPNVTFDGIHVDAGGINPGNQALDISADDVTFKNGSTGNIVDQKAAQANGDNIVFDNVLFHDAVLRTSGVHMECLYAIVVPNMIIRNSRFTHCAVMDVFFTSGTWWNPPSPHYGGVTIENNIFEPSMFDDDVCCHYYGFVIGMTSGSGTNENPGSILNWTIRHNRFDNAAAWGGNAAIEAARPFINTITCGNTGEVPASWKVPC